jgi:ferredoxin, 2Fe-2S
MRWPFIEPDGSENQLDVSEGTNIMQAALENGVIGIMGDCGGACSCATCHCYIDESFISRLPVADSIEASMLDFATDLKPNSRLGYQVTILEEISGIVIRLPESQY